MIDKDILIGTIEAFDKKLQKVKEELDKAGDNATIEMYREWLAMEKAWLKLGDVVEMEILKFTRDEV